LAYNTPSNERWKGKLQKIVIKSGLALENIILKNMRKIKLLLDQKYERNSMLQKKRLSGITQAFYQV